MVGQIKTSSYSLTEIGWCYSKAGADVWDCQRVRDNGDSRQGADAKKVTIEDGKFAGPASTFKRASWVGDTSVEVSDNWVSSESKSETDCTIAANNALPVAIGYASVTCAKINHHWYKNFETSDKENDNQLTLDDAGVEYDIFGWMASFSRTDYSTVQKEAVGAVTKFTPVSTQFKEEQEKPDPVVDNTDDGQDGEDDDHEGHDHEEDGAAGIAASAVAVFAVAALSF